MHAGCCSDRSDKCFFIIVASSEWERVFAMSFTFYCSKLDPHGLEPWVNELSS